MPAGRCAPDPNAVWIEAKPFGLRSQPADSGFAIFELRGKERFTAEAVINRRDRIPIQEKVQWNRFNRESLFGSKEKCAPMNPHDQGKLPGLFRYVKVEGLAGPPTGDVGKVSLAYNVAGEFFGHQ